MVVYSDELCHWAKGSARKNHKYLKREWKNGRWRYWYSTDYDKSISGTIRRISGADLRDYANQKKEIYEDKKHVSDWWNENVYTTDPKLKARIKGINAETQVAKNKADYATRQYEKTPLGIAEKAGKKISTITKSTIDSGREIVSDILALEARATAGRALEIRRIAQKKKSDKLMNKVAVLTAESAVKLKKASDKIRPDKR